MTEQFTEAQTAILAKRAISPEIATTAGVRSIQSEADLPPGSPDYWTTEAGYLPGLLFRYSSPGEETTVWQLRPDTPVVGADGDVKKYVFPPDSPSVLNTGRPDGEAETVLIVEGTCQTIAASAAAPDGIAVYGIAGCQSWMKAGVPSSDLFVVSGRDVLIALDADATTNLNVYEAGVALREACLAEGALSVRFLRVPGGGKSGLDDVLAVREEKRRSEYLANLIELTRTRPKAEKPELPAATKPKPKSISKTEGVEAEFFAGEKLKVATLAAKIVTNRPAALTRENKIALYVHGVYKIDGTGFLSELTDLLGESFRTSHEKNAEAYTVGQLAKRGNILPDQIDEPLLNCSNVMVDLRTGESLPHDPVYHSVVQIPVEWDPEATCPTYEAWAAEQVGAQLDDLEESVALMLDPTITPTKAVFLFGPSRSGKSTYLRLMQEIAGKENVEGVTLHQLSEDKFAAANLYGKTLNIAADLSAAHVEDISVFKLMTGEDLIHANRKYGQQFSFVNRALFAFSANELPTVGESSRAYSERVKPFFFGNSFAGREDPSLEPRLRAELPGILVRLVKAHQRRSARGHVLPTDPTVRQMFELASDRVRQFVVEACEIVPIEIGQGGAKNATISTTTEIYRAFQEWATDEGKASMAKSKMRARLSTVPGVVEAVSSGKSRGWNVRVRPRSEWYAVAQNGGTLSVSPLPAHHVDPSSLKDGDTEDMRSHVGEEGSKRTKFLNPDAFLSARAAAVPAPSCPDCDSAEELVPPENFWHACRRCHPATFTRG